MIPKWVAFIFLLWYISIKLNKKQQMMKGVEIMDSKNNEVFKVIISVLTLIIMIFFCVDFILQTINGSQNREFLDIMLVFLGVVILLFSTDDSKEK